MSADHTAFILANLAAFDAAVEQNKIDDELNIDHVELFFQQFYRQWFDRFPIAEQYTIVDAEHSAWLTEKMEKVRFILGARHTRLRFYFM